MEIIDLPGTYSLTAKSIDELIARNFIVEEKPDVVVDIVDASNLERNLYLTIQLLELEANLVVALNKFDVAKNLGYEIDVKKLSNLLGVPVVPTVATTKEGMEELKDKIVEAALKKRKPPKVVYGEEAERVIEAVEEVLKKDITLVERYPTRWLAIKLLEGDEEAMKIVEKSPYRDEIMEVLS